MRSAVAAALLAASLLGCASEISLRAPGADLRAGRVVFMPSMVALYQIRGCDLLFDEGRSRLGRAMVDRWLRFHAAALHVRLADLRELDAAHLSSGELYNGLDRLSRAMFADWGGRPLAAWNFSKPMPEWATALKADYLAFVVVGGAEDPRVEQAGCDEGFVIPLRRTQLVIVELQTGRVVRFRAIKFEDIDSAHIAEAVSKLMDVFDPPTRS